MSAIVGIYHPNNHPINEIHSIEMLRALEKFPADDVQIWEKQNVFLGCHAQWITPEAVGEKLPYFDQDRKLAITADAIIDNRKELFDLLQVSKPLRINMPDSKLILLAYERWGKDSPLYLVGDFAFMIWDERKEQLFGARDFSGSRTLYYYKDDTTFAFSTTIAPLFTIPSIEKALNEEWLAEFISIPEMFNSIDLYSTVYQSIKQVPPSHTVTITKSGICFSEFNHFSSIKKLRLQSNEEYEEAFREVFQEAVDSKTRSSSEIGAHLSGGLDSGTVVGFTAKSLKKTGKPLHTFSYVPLHEFTDWTPKSKVANERPFIKSTVNHVGNIIDNYYSFETKSPLSEINDWLDTMEMPYKFFENSYWMSGIYEMASQHGIKILLNGARGNYTISWGNGIDYYTKLFKQIRWIHLFNEINQYKYLKSTGNKAILMKVVKRAFANLNGGLKQSSHSSFPVIINSDFANQTKVLKLLESQDIDPRGNRVLNTYKARENQFKKLYYWGNGTSSTKLSLKYSIWNRDPTNDLRVVKFCLSLPDSQYVQNGLDRSLVRRVTKNLLPDEIRLNTNYRGVQGADGIDRIGDNWNKLMEELDWVVKDPAISNYLNQDILQNSLEKIRYERKSEQIFNPNFKVLMRSLILSRFINRNFEGGDINESKRLDRTKIRRVGH
ncbi:asparagine synthase-related protein [Halobacillus sp. B29]|uniref:asparagine synthase-related protein n=1 Tax=Halobacillus sp. B29 TaxID=3457432 RepID=UPI003FCD5DCA